MARHDLQTTQLRCPDESCGGAMVRDECGVFCQVCGFEAVTWADPVDADVPMNVIVRRERTKRRALAGAAAALLIAVVGLAFWLKPSGAGATSELRDPAQLTYAEVAASFGRGHLPASLNLPEFYAEPDLFMLPRMRVAQSPLVLWWGQRSTQEKLDLLELLKVPRAIELLPFALEISWFTTAQEQDFDVARGMLDALYASAENHLDLATFVCEHVASVSTIPAVQVDARRYVAALLERRRQLGY